MGSRDEEDEEEDAVETRIELRSVLANIALDSEVTQENLARSVPDQAPQTTSSGAHDVEVGRTLGRGGMALVRLGHQLKLDRAVAVKTLHDSRRSELNITRLLREARITGRLEHPNIVPVHDIVSGEDGIPQVVLKLIEGDTWTALMRKPDRVRERFGATDLLEWNLGVLMAVSRALSFAHSRQVLHRDVKPSNVMVGPFGEVYLLDWGIALDLDAPDSEDRDEVMGTPSYMAPEQLLGGQLGTWTDTYLLGAMLYQLLGGRAPHADTTPEVRVMREASDEVAPPLPDDVPAELRRIVDAALEPEPEKRTARPEDLRLALVAFLQHRGALRLVERAHRERTLAASAHRDGDDAAWERSCLAAELAYRASLDEWPEWHEAIEGVRELAVLRIEHALARGEAHAASRLVEAHSELPEELRQRVASEVARMAEEEAQLRRIISDSDRRLGHRMRGILGGAFGFVWVGFWCFVALYPPETVMPLIAFTVAVGLVGATAVATFARQMLQNRINRTSMWVVVTGLLMTVIWFVGASWLGLDMRTILIGQLFVFAVALGGMANLMDPWGAVSGVGFVVAFLVACYEPAWMAYSVIGGNVLLLVNQLVLNAARARRGFATQPTARALTKP